MSDLTSLFTDTLAKFSFRAVLSAAATLLICLVAVHLLGKLLRRLLARTKLDERIQKYLLAGVKLILYIVTVLIVAESLNIPMTSLVALLSVGSLGVTLAAEDILGNVAGGLVILSAHPFSIGDYVEVGGVAGTVHEISLNHTKLVTPDGHLVMLPNKELASSQMTNYTVLGRRRVVQRVAASYDPHGDGEGRLPARSGADGKPAGGPGSHRLPHRIQGELYRVHRLLLGYAGELVGRVSGSGGAPAGRLPGVRRGDDLQPPECPHHRKPKLTAGGAPGASVYSDARSGKSRTGRRLLG